MGNHGQWNSILVDSLDEDNGSRSLRSRRTYVDGLYICIGESLLTFWPLGDVKVMLRVWLQKDKFTSPFYPSAYITTLHHSAKETALISQWIDISFQWLPDVCTAVFDVHIYEKLKIVRYTRPELCPITATVDGLSFGSMVMTTKSYLFSNV